MGINEADLCWWLDLAAEARVDLCADLRDSAPHSYVVLGRTEGMTAEDYVRAARVIHTYGRPAKFYGMTSIYLTSPDGQLKWWTMDADVKDTNLINQATTDRLYGVQNAPSTESGISTSYDEIATSYDEASPTPAGLAEALREAVTKHSGEFPPAVLDVGCGTGRVARSWGHVARPLRRS